MSGGWGLAVVVPARDEAATVVRCLRSVTRSLARARAAGLVDRTQVVLVADSCLDATAELAATVPGVRVLEAALGSVGAARSAGCRAVLGKDDRLWLAHTDADSVVPPGWAGHHVVTATSGADALIGTVRLPRRTPEALVRAWSLDYRPGPGHRHVHGANLGVRAQAYERVGGFPRVPQDEDVALVAALEAAGARVVRDDVMPVTTSARLSSRTPGGFGAHLGSLAVGALTEPAA